MLKNLCYVALVIVWRFGDATPAGLDRLEFDKLDADIDSLKYEAEEEDLDDFSKLLDEAAKTNDNANVKTSGFKKKKTANKGVKGTQSIQDLKKFYKTLGARDHGAYDDDDLRSEVDSSAAEAVGITGKEDRKYRKGTKTVGYHRVQHKDDYKKDKEIYEEDEVSGNISKVGAKAKGLSVSGGAKVHKGHYKHDRKKGVFGKQGFSDKGYLDKELKEFSDAEGFDGSFNNDS